MRRGFIIFGGVVAIFTLIAIIDAYGYQAYYEPHYTGYERKAPLPTSTNPQWFAYSDTYDFYFSFNKLTYKAGDTIVITGNGHPRSQVYASIFHPDGEIHWKPQLAVIHKTHDWEMKIQLPHNTPKGDYTIKFWMNKTFDEAVFKVV